MQGNLYPVSLISPLASGINLKVVVTPKVPQVLLASIAEVVFNRKNSQVFLASGNKVTVPSETQLSPGAKIVY